MWAIGRELIKRNEIPDFVSKLFCKESNWVRHDIDDDLIDNEVIIFQYFLIIVTRGRKERKKKGGAKHLFCDIFNYTPHNHNQ